MRHPLYFEHERVRYDLTHLQPKRVSVVLKAHKNNPELNLMIDIKFSSHCFSEGKPKTTGTLHDFKDHNKWPRWFCPKRHATSLILPELITQLPKKKCFFTGKDNWLIIELIGENGESNKFYIYFTLRKNVDIENGVLLFIESAYEKTKGDNFPKRSRSMDRTNFAMLARKKLAGKSVRRPIKR